MAAPTYFDTCWSILSSIGIFCAISALLMMGIFGRNKLLTIPLVASVAVAIADGLCYYAYVSDAYPFKNRLVAAAIADIAWGVQEICLPLYTFFILGSILTGKTKTVYIGLFTFCLFSAFCVRCAILICRQYHMRGTDLQQVVNWLHVAYFCSIAVAELINSKFLVDKLRGHIKTTADSLKSSNLRSIVTSSESRMAAFCCIGGARAILFPFATAAQDANNKITEGDRFVAVFETLFPVMMLIDFALTRAVKSKGQGTQHGSQVSSAKRTIVKTKDTTPANVA